MGGELANPNPNPNPNPNQTVGGELANSSVFFMTYLMILEGFGLPFKVEKYVSKLVTKEVNVHYMHM